MTIKTQIFQIKQQYNPELTTVSNSHRPTYAL